MFSAAASDVAVDTVSVAAIASGRMLTSLPCAHEPLHALGSQRAWHLEDGAGATPAVRLPQRPFKKLSEAVLHAFRGAGLG